MAVDSVWGKPGGAWADDVDEQEQSGTLAAPAAPFGKEEAFPSLSAAKEAPAKKKAKGKPVPLGAFLGGSAAAANRANMDEKSILLNLPKASSGAPREEGQGGGLGGGFREYGGDRGGGRRGGFDRDGDGERPPRREMEPSRADEADDWGATRKFTPSEPSDRRGGFGSGGFGERRGGGGFSDRDRGGDGERPPRREAAPSAADEVDDWGANRKFTPSEPSERRGPGGGGGGGFRDRDGPAGGERRRFDEPSRADEGDWGARRAPPPADDRAAPSGRRPGFGFSGNVAADTEDRWSRGTAAASTAAPSSSSDAPRERPRLNLAPRTKPPPSPTPGSPVTAAAAAPAEDGAGGEQQQARAAAKPNPFGAARPREEVLKEKGIDYVKEELKLEHGEVIRDKTPEEEALEKEVEALRVQLEGMKELQAGETDTLDELAAELDEKEKSLYKLQAELDDRVRFSKGRPEREDRPPREAGDDRGFERAGPRRERGEREQQQQERGGEGGDAREGREARGGGSFRDREPREGGGFGGRGGGSFRDRDGARDGGRGRGPPPQGERRTPAW